MGIWFEGGSREVVIDFIWKIKWGDRLLKFLFFRVLMNNENELFLERKIINFILLF